MTTGPEFELLRGQIDGAIAVAKVALWAIGSALGLIIALVSYIFIRLEKVVDMLHTKSNGLETRTAILESWKELKERA